MKTKIKLYSIFLIATMLTFSCKKDNLDEAILSDTIEETQNSVSSSTETSSETDTSTNAENGTDGQDGENGTNGTDGQDGSDGTDGADGEDGTNGSDGQDGADGEQGPQGPQGEQGPAGTDGENGQNGADGEQGPQGPQGEQGPAGTNGEDGEDGNANVIATNWQNANFASSWSSGRAYAEINDSRINTEVLNNYAVLAYARNTPTICPFPVCPTNPTIPLPWFHYKYTIHYVLYPSTFKVYAEETENSEATPPTNIQIRYILIEPSSLSGKSANINFSKMSYEEVINHFGLEL